MSCLITTSDNGENVSVSIREPLEIGRSSKDFVVVARAKSDTISLGITDATVSRIHACIYFESEKLMIKDLGSKNGTFLNDTLLPEWKPGKESKPVQIEANSNVRFGYNTIVRIALGEMTLTPEEWRKITT